MTEKSRDRRMASSCRLRYVNRAGVAWLSVCFGYFLSLRFITLRVRIPNDEVLGIWVVVVLERVFGEHVIIEYLDP